MERKYTRRRVASLTVLRPERVLGAAMGRIALAVTTAEHARGTEGSRSGSKRIGYRCRGETEGSVGASAGAGFQITALRRSCSCAALGVELAVRGWSGGMGGEPLQATVAELREKL